MWSGSSNAPLLAQATTHTSSRLITYYLAKTHATPGRFLHTVHTTNTTAAALGTAACHSSKMDHPVPAHKKQLCVSLPNSVQWFQVDNWKLAMVEIYVSEIGKCNKQGWSPHTLWEMPLLNSYQHTIVWNRGRKDRTGQRKKRILPTTITVTPQAKKLKLLLCWIISTSTLIRLRNRDWVMTSAPWPLVGLLFDKLGAEFYHLVNLF